VNDPNYSTGIGFVLERWQQSRFLPRVGRAAWERGAVMTEQWGADAIFRLKDDKLTFASYYKIHGRTRHGNCVAHHVR